MIDRRGVSLLLASALLIVAVAMGALGYGVGRFVTPPEQIITTTTTTTTTTQVSTSVVTLTTTSVMTTTSTVVRELPQTFPPPANSTAIIRGRLLFNGTVFVTYSIDKPTYSIGETVHMKSTITNLSPSDMSFDLGGGGSMIELGNSTNRGVWYYPEFQHVFNVFPIPPVKINVSPGETKTIPWMTADWNMKGLHSLPERNVYNEYYVPWSRDGVSLKGDFYNNYYVSAGQYTIVWPTTISEIGRSENFDEQITFTITK